MGRGATTNAILELGEYLVGQGIEKVTLESTSDYWRICFYLLEAARAGRAAGQRPRRQERAGPAEDRQAGRGLAGQADRAGHAAALVRAAGRDPECCATTPGLRVDLTRERTRHWQRLEKLLEDALIKVSAVASTLDTMSVRDMIEALIAGERDPQVLAGLARGRMKAKRAALIEALTGRFDDHHAELARMLLDQIDQLTAQIDQLTTRIERTDRRAIPAAQRQPTPTAPPAPAPAGGTARRAAARHRSPGPRSPASAGEGAQAIIAEIGLDMSQFPTAGHLVSWAKLCPRTIQSGATSTRRARPAKATPTSKASSARPPPPPPAPTPSSANATGASSNAAANSKPSSPSPAPSWSSSGTCWPTPPPATTTSARTTTAPHQQGRKTRNHIRSSKHSATPSPSPQPPDQHLPAAPGQPHAPGPAQPHRHRPAAVPTFRSAGGRPLAAVSSGGRPCQRTSTSSRTRSMTPYSSASVFGMEIVEQRGRRATDVDEQHGRPLPGES